MRQNMGWEKFLGRQVNGPVTDIDNFFTRDGSQSLMFLATKDI